MSSLTFSISSFFAMMMNRVLTSVPGILRSHHGGIGSHGLRLVCCGLLLGSLGLNGMHQVTSIILQLQPFYHASTLFIQGVFWVQFPLLPAALHAAPARQVDNTPSLSRLGSYMSCAVLVGTYSATIGSSACINCASGDSRITSFCLIVHPKIKFLF